jgi:predicted ATPase/class 3 adenylate cyclase/DNA-binding CsgD family transcriptional regulator/predicted negative regulator of RcsB-dependent stress response
MDRESRVGAPSELPTGTVTFLLTDVEGSTRLWQERHDDMAAAIARHYEIADETITGHRGARPVEQGEGDSLVAVFTRATDAVSCTLALQLAFASEPWPGGLELLVRMALHTGEALLRDEGNYAGEAISRCARLRSLAHGGQTLLSRAAHEIVVDHLPEGATLLDLGSHRLRDLARPERVYQLCHAGLKGEFPPLRSLDAVLNNLPLQVTTFIGREEQMAGIKNHLAETRMLTLTGAGGCGKTRLSLEVAAGLVAEHPDGVWWVDLAAISDPELVPNAVAGSLGIREVPGQPVTETLVRQLHPRHALVILDNCEHLVDACAALADALLRSCPTVTLIATSREPLGLNGEVALRVPSLELPPRAIAPGSFGQYEAVRLFIDRALKARPNFRATHDNAPAIAEICHRLDGIPLAIELAAARSRMLTPEQITAALGDVFRLLTGGARTALPRQRTLEASVDWSYNLLSEDERRLLARLSTFAGSFSLDAAEAVCTDEIVPTAGVLDLLTGLVDKSLVQVDEQNGGPARYRLLETIRYYARQKLVAAGDTEAVRERHLDFFLSLAEAAEVEIEAGHPGWWIDQLETEIDNIRAALEHSTTERTAAKVSRLAAALFLYWEIRRVREGRRYLETAVAREGLEPVVRAKVLSPAAEISLADGDPVAALALADEAYGIAAEIENTGIMARARSIGGWSAVFVAPDRALPYLEEAERLAREANVSWALENTVCALGYLHVSLGDPETAMVYLNEAIGRAESAGTQFIHVALSVSAMATTLLGNLSDALARAERALEASQALQDTLWISIAEDLKGWILTLTGRYEDAEAALAGGLHVATETSNAFGLAYGFMYLGTLEHGTGRHAEAVEHLTEAAGIQAELNQAWERAWCLSVLAAAETALGRRSDARAHLDDAMETGRRSGNPIAAAFTALTIARLDREEGNLESAEAQMHESLELVVPAGCRWLAVEAIEGLAGVAAARGDARGAARLFGAAEAGRGATGSVRFPLYRDAYAADVDGVRDGLGADFDAAWKEGSALSLDEAVAYARRGRGPRRRPRSGWASLSPAELDVVRLVAQGLTNVEIGKRLFISPRTAQTHLTRIFGKLGVSSRAALASEATRQDARA